MLNNLDPNEFEMVKRIFDEILFDYATPGELLSVIASVLHDRASAPNVRDHIKESALCQCRRLEILGGELREEITVLEAWVMKQGEIRDDAKP